MSCFGPKAFLQHTPGKGAFLIPLANDLTIVMKALLFLSLLTPSSIHPTRTFYVEGPVLGTAGHASRHKPHIPNSAVWICHVNSLGHSEDAMGFQEKGCSGPKDQGSILEGGGIYLNQQRGHQR